MRILFLTHYFHPEVGAAQTRILESARLLQGRGHDVTVLTGFPNYPDGIIPERYRGRWRQTEWLGGIEVIRSAVYPAPNRGFGKRLLNHVSFALSCIPSSRRASPPDVVIAETPPLFTAAAAVAVARLRGARLLLNVSDLWPESAVQLGMLKNRAAIRVAEAIERFAYRYSDIIAVPTPGMRTLLIARGYAEEKVRLLPNAVDIDRFTPRSQERAAGKRVLYCGTVGMAQGVGLLLEAARRLEEEGQDIDFLVVGDGAERAELEAQAKAWKLKRVTFTGRVPSEEVPDYIESADIAVMTLRDLPLFEDALPTKLLEYMAAGRPVAAAASGQVARLLTSTQAGIPSPPEDAGALAESIRRLASDSEAARRMGECGRRYVTAHLSRRAMVDKLDAALEAINR